MTTCVMLSRKHSRLSENGNAAEKRRQTAEVIADAHDVFAVQSGLKPYRNRKEFHADLQRVIEEDYGVTLVGVPLEEAAMNVDQFLKAFL